MDGFRAPSAGDFSAYGSLISQQAGHFGDLTAWSTSQCVQTDGLEGLLTPLTEVIPPVGHFLGEKLAQCGRGMHLVADKIHRTSADYTNTDQATAADLRSLYPGAVPGLPGVSSIPGAGLLGNFTDEDVNLKEPDDADESTAKAIKTQLLLALNAKDLKMADHLFQWCTGQSLVDLLIKPIFGDFGRLKYLENAYKQLSDGVFTVAGTVRKGSWKLGSEWTGQTGTNFDQYMFQWSMGIGGIGDGAEIASKAFKDGYEVVCGLVLAAIEGINWLMDKGIHRLAELAAEMLAGDAAIEAVGGGPEDPLADAAALIWSADKIYEIYEVVRDIINKIGLIEAIFQKISEAIDEIKTLVHKVIAFLGSPPSLGSLIDDVEQRGFEFEKSGSWSPELGVARIALLPAA
jgi:hypothetical protein